MSRYFLSIFMTVLLVTTNLYTPIPNVSSHGDHNKKPICDELPADCGGCVWPEYRHDNLNTGYVPKECAPPCDDLFEIWRKVLSPEEHILTPPVIECGLVYIGTTAGTFYALNANTGVTKWMKANLGAIRTSACVYKGKVYVGTDTGFVYCFDAITGDLVPSWPVQVFYQVSTAIKVLENKVFVGTSIGQFWCFNINGLRHWPLPFGTGGEIIGAPAVGYGFVWFGSMDGYLYCVDITYGTSKLGWPVYVGAGNGSVPSIGNDTLYYKTNVLNVLDMLNGTNAANSAIAPNIVTNVALDNNSPYVPNDSLVYAGNDDNLVYKTRNKSSIRLWSRLIANLDGINSTPSITEDRIYFNSNGDLYVVDAFYGGTLNVIPIPMVHINEKLSSIAIAYNKLYFTSSSCTIYSYGCCKPKERYPKSIILVPSPNVSVRRNCELQFKALVIANDGSVMPELDEYVEYYSDPSPSGSIDLKTGLFKAGSVVSPPFVIVWARLKMSYLTNLGTTIDVNITSPTTTVNITP